MRRRGGGSILVQVLFRSRRAMALVFAVLAVGASAGADGHRGSAEETATASPTAAATGGTCAPASDAPAIPGAAPDCACRPRDEVGGDAPSRSVGYPWRGRLEGGLRLTASPRIHLMEVDVPRGNFWGTRSLVHLLQRVAERVAAAAPGARLNVGELSRRGGGNLVGHRSHESGRDVDLGFYLTDEAGVPYEPRRFVNVNRHGRGRDGETAVRFDDLRNWLLIAALVGDEGSPVQHAFVHRSVRARILAEGRRQGASEALLAQVERVVISPGVRHPHRNHFHVRIYCPAEDVPACRDRGPFWPWLPPTHPFAARIVPLPGWPVDAP